MNFLLAKKSFFDCWDNLFPFLTSNVVFAFLVFGLRSIKSAWLCILVLLAMSFHIAGVNSMVFCWLNGNLQHNSNFKNYRIGLANHIGHTFLLFGVLVLAFVFFTLVLPMAMGFGNMGLQITVYCSLGFIIVFLCASSFLLPLSAIMEKDSAFKSLKKCFLLLFDNRHFGFFAIFKMVGDFGLSYLLKMIIPGITAVCVSQINASMMVMKKYDWMEAKGETATVPKPEEYLKEEFKNVKERSLSELIHPFRQQ